MSIKIKLIMSYILVTLFIIVLSVTFISSSKKVSNFVNKSMMSLLTDKEIANTIDSEFKNVVISLKSARASSDAKEIQKFASETNTSFAKISDALNRAPDNKDFKQFAEISKNLKDKTDTFLKTKAEYITVTDKMMLLFDDMDSMFRKQKGYIFVSQTNLAKFGTRFKNTLNFLDRMMEDPLEIKVYISELVNAKDEIDAEDAVYSITNFAQTLDDKAKVLLNGGDYKGEALVRMNIDEVRQKLNLLVEVTEQMISSSDELRTIRLKNIELEHSLTTQIDDLEKTVGTTAQELDVLNSTAQTNMDKGVKDINTLSSRLMTTTIVMLIIVMTLAIAIGLFTSNKITSPLTKIMNVAESIKDGNLQCGNLTHSSSDEFGALTNSINKMQQSLCELVNNIKDSTDYLSKTSDQSTDLMHKMHENLNNTNIEMAAAASAAEELSSSTINIIDSVQVGIKEVQAAKKKVLDGNKGLQTSISQVSSVAQNLSGVAASLNELKNASQEITNIVSIIVDIAEQTNLLALNAAIEAARAGEAGRGFAVVADEVRKLAEKTSTSTQEISSMVGSIQGNVQDVVDIVHSGIVEVEESSKSITSVGENFEEVVRQMESAANSVEPILVIIEQQSEAISNITSTVTNVSVASEENKEIVDEVNVFSDKLAELSHDLQQKISHFKA